jgi:hypothetical protein
LIRRLVALVALLAILIPHAPANAFLGSYRDGDDAIGRPDLSTVRLGLVTETQRYAFRYKTYLRYNLKRRGTIALYVDSVGERRWDYLLYLQWDGGSSGYFCDRDLRPGAGGAKTFASVKWEVEPRSGLCVFQGIRRTKPIRWRVVVYERVGIPEGNVVDTAPNTGWY